MRDVVEKYFDDVIIRNLQDFTNTLNVISPLIDGWGVAEPVSAHRIMQLSNKQTRIASYKEFFIPKKSGGERHIYAPCGILKQLQAALNVIIQTMFQPSPYVTGFTIGKNIRDNAVIHLGQTCIHNIDIENFFPSITKEMIRHALIKELADKIPSKQVINIICNLCTLPVGDIIEILPQGAPTSPVISNIVLKKFDLRMSHLAEKFGCRYSRYADDMTLSHNNKIRKMHPVLLDGVNKIVEEYGLKINSEKTKTMVPGQRMEVTGIVINEKTNVTRTYIKQLRTLLHIWGKYGYKRAQQIYTFDFCDGIKKDLRSVIKGKINYLEMVKGNADPTLQRYRHRLKILEYNTF